jgi:hypothetical protein
MGYGWSDDRGSSGGGSSRYDTPDYSSARSAYDDDDTSSRSSRGRSARSGRMRSRAGASEADRSVTISRRFGETPHPIGKTIATESTHPICVGMDDTGSMGDKPPVILTKLPVLGTEAGKISKDYAISFSLVSDARCDSYGLRVRDFDSGEALDEHLAALAPQGGGGDAPESYGIWAYYLLNHCEIDKAVKPIAVLICDAPPHDQVLPSEVSKVTGDHVQSALNTESLFKQLQKKFSVYVVYYGGRSETWERIVGRQSVIYTSDSHVGDIVELLSGIVAGECGGYEEFEMRSSRRHSDRPDRSARVSKALKSVSKKSAEMASAGRSTEAGKSRTSKTKSGSGSKKGSKKLASKKSKKLTD